MLCNISHNSTKADHMEDDSRNNEDGPRLSCMTCHVLMSNREEHTTHHKSDFHRFNLKRKMVDLPPVTQEVFEAKVDALKPGENKNNEDLSCSACRKQFNTSNTYRQHLESKKHKDNVTKEQASDQPKSKGKAPSNQPEAEKIPDNETEEEKEAREDREFEERVKNAPKLTLEDCLFCSEQRDYEANLKHMATYHGFFIPDMDYMVDLPGLIAYLGQKLSIGNVCLYCDRYFGSLQAVRHHMADVGHCKLSYDGDAMLEYDDFYDFENATDIPDIDANIAEEGEYSLKLANGKVLGHRSLQVYYKQVYKVPETREVVLANQNLSKQYKALGWHDQGSAQSRAEMRAGTRQTLGMNKRQVQMGLRSNWLWRFRNENITQRNSGR